MQLQTLNYSMLGHFGDIQWISFHPQCVSLWSADVKPSVLFYEKNVNMLTAQKPNVGYDPVQ